MKRHGIRYGILFCCCLLLLGAAYQFSFQYAKHRALEEAQIKEEIKREAGREVRMAAAEGSTGEDEVYVLKDLNGFIAVYKADGKTVFEYTSIVAADLPEEVRKEIEKGKEIRTVQKLYGFLENYSS